ncbi:LacI family DNA-binding transcriptional regulator [Actinomycetes bacterium KLBMP 9797]
MSEPARVRMEAVARAAGVSQSLVSKVLNNRPGVSDATRQRVQQIIAQSGYQRRPRTRRSGKIEVIFRTMNSAINPLLVRGLARSLEDSGYTFAVTAVGVDDGAGSVSGAGSVIGTGSISGAGSAGGAGWVDALVRRRPAGAIMSVVSLPATVRERFTRARIPFVVLDTVGDAPADTHAVGSTQWRGGYLATRHLLDLGHRRIGMISGPLGFACSLARVGGYHAALREAGVPADPVLVRSGVFQTGPGRALAHELLALPEPPTAVVAGNDLQALGVIDACYDRQLRVPDDLSVVGYDDQDAAAVAVPALTTVRQPLADMAEEAGRIVMRQIDRPTPLPIRFDLTAALIHRKTTAPLP